MREAEVWGARHRKGAGGGGGGARVGRDLPGTRCGSRDAAGAKRAVFPASDGRSARNSLLDITTVIAEIL